MDSELPFSFVAVCCDGHGRDGDDEDEDDEHGAVASGGGGNDEA